MNAQQPATDGVWLGSPPAAVKTRQRARIAWRVPHFAMGVLIGALIVLLVWLLG